MMQYLALEQWDAGVWQGAKGKRNGRKRELNTYPQSCRSKYLMMFDTLQKTVLFNLKMTHDWWNYMLFLSAGKFGYASIYGDLPEFSLEKKQAPLITAVPSERHWETLFSGPSHNLPPLTKLCSLFLESLLEKRSSAVEWSPVVQLSFCWKVESLV